MDEDQLRHGAPAWEFKADDELAVTAEVLPVRRLPDGNLEVCCVPFRTARLALGDVVRPTENGYALVGRSGHGTVQVWLGDSFLPREDLAQELVGLGAVVERHGENLLAIDLAPTVSPRVLELLRDHATRSQVRLNLSQPAVVPLHPATAESIAVRLRTFLQARGEAIGTDDLARVNECLDRGEPRLALEKLLPLIAEHDVVLTPTEHAALLGMWESAGLPANLLPSYTITISTSPPGGPGRTLAAIVAWAQESQGIELQWGPEQRVALSVETTSADPLSFQVGALPQARFTVIGPAEAEHIGPYLVLTGFNYAEVTREISPFHPVTQVVTGGELVLGPSGAADFRQGGADSATARLSQPLARLRDLLAAPGSLRRLARLWTWPQLFTPMAIGVIMAIFGLGVSAQTGRTLPLLLLLPAAVLVIAPPVWNRARRVSAEPRFARDGWISTGVPFSDDAGGVRFELLLPEEMPLRQRTAVTQRVAVLVRDADVSGPLERRLRWHVTRGLSVRELDPELPSKAVLRGVNQQHPPAAAYAVAPRASGAVVDVLTIRPGALRTTGVTD